MLTLKNIRISTKVYGGFGAVIGFLLIISATAWWSLNNADNNSQRYRVLAAQTTEVGKVEKALLETELYVKTFLSSPSPEVVAQVNESREEVKQRLEALAALPLDDAERATLETITTDIEAYFDAFSDVSRLEDQRSAIIRDELTVSGQAMEDNLTKLMRSAFEEYLADVAYLGGEVMRSVLLMRIDANKFYLQPDQEAFDALVAESAVMDDNHGRLKDSVYDGSRVEQSNAVIELHETYMAAAQRLFDTVKSRNTLVDETLMQLGSKILSDTTALARENAEKQRVLGEQTTSSNRIAMTIAMVVAAVSVILGIALAFLIGTGISRPILAITHAMTALAGGDKGTEIPGQDHKDEIGDMAAAVQVFKENMIKADELTAQQLEDTRIREERAKKIESLTQDFDRKVAELLDAFGESATETESTSTAMNRIAEETNHRATTVAAAAEEATANVQSVAAATEELSNSSHEIGRQVTQSSEIASRAADQAQDTNRTVQGLAEAAKEIDEVVQLISDIAEQTNLLALNATIEAARAGDAGKGFAVVANEVKSLATQTAQATEDIGRRISTIQGETGAAVDAIQSIAKTVNEINEITAAIAAAVEEQVATTGEITRNIEQAASGAQEVSSNIVEVTKAAGETGAAAGQMTTVSSQMKTKADDLRHQVEDFLKGVRAV